MPEMQEIQETGIQSMGCEGPLEGKWQPTLVFLQRNPQGHKESDMTQHSIFTLFIAILAFITFRFIFPIC